MKPVKGSRILIVKLSSIGDVVMATPAARVLREALPEAYIAWVVEPKSADIVVGNPYLDETIIWNRTSSPGWATGVARFVSQARDLRHELRERRFDVALDLQGLLRSAVVMSLSGAKVRIGYSDARECAPLLYTHRLRPDRNACIQQRHLDLLEPLGIRSNDVAMTVTVADTDRAFAEEFFDRHQLDPHRTLAFCPATSRAIKHWFNDHWARLGEILWQDQGIRALIFGSPADVYLADDIRSRTSAPLVSAAGETSLKQAAALMEKCAAVVGVDTGLLHIGVGLDLPAVGLFGPHRWKSLVRKPNFIWLTKDFPCSPCRRKPVCENVDCMRAIVPEDVVKALFPWLSKRAGVRSAK